MGIQGNASLMLLDIENSHPHYRKLKNIEKYIEGGAELTGQLSGFARGGKYIVRSMNLNLLISKTCDRFDSQKKGFKISTKFQEGIWPVEVDPKQMELVFMKMYAHALHTMPAGGELLIQTINCPLEEDRAKALGLRRGKCVKVSMTDSGVGMDSKTQRRLFEPFFTSREMGTGKGLGLAAVYGIIRHHDGVIQVESEKGKGSTYHIYLPAIDEEQQSKENIKQNPGQMAAGKGTILLVDDEEMIREVGEEFLETLGYSVILARGGNEAIALYKENKKTIDVVILDLIMPDMSGDTVYERLKAINHDVKVLLASGFCVDGKTTEMLQKGCKDYIQKPYNMAILSKKISSLLDDNFQNTLDI